ncbi:hypothetical protein AVEN_91992-1 [Araneus ventricosus]|uniref:Uncharacterized protein n=1 Tax=Araneus ventricosus TaxID=182803 RepID=A0A4Y2TF47_ARAVE|nr:hypothetical protein AVEN_266552-1 [Araneus ventricosus]GBN98033.1 hypothetical protein AVEN_91992-1 [Araneus ventricosus]
MEKDALFTNIPENMKHRKLEKPTLAQINNTNRQQITNNNNKSTQRLIADQFAKRRRLQRDLKAFKHTPKTILVVQHLRDNHHDEGPIFEELVPSSKTKKNPMSLYTPCTPVESYPTVCLETLTADTSECHGQERCT